MAYLRGPITRARLGELNQLVGADKATPLAEATVSVKTAVTGTRPTVPNSVDEYFLPNNQTVSEAIKAAGDGKYTAKGLIYRPVLLA